MFHPLKQLCKGRQKKTQKLTRLPSGCSFFYTFCQFLQVDYFLRTENFTNTCQRARFCERRHDCRSNFTSQVAGPCEGRARNGNENSQFALSRHEK